MAHAMDPQHHPLIKSFLSNSSSLEASTEQNADQPNYWTADPNALLTTSNIHSLNLATGNRTLASILPALETAESEVIFVTCYWAVSESLNQICDSLRKLSSKALADGRTIRVRICFSSSGLLQKLFHTQSAAGKVYEPSEWIKALGLPGPDELKGLDLQVKSVFLLPISIIHPKFVVVDRKRAFLPSCNVSWEEWFEGCVELSGPVVAQFVRFWEEFWADAQDRELSSTTITPSSEATAAYAESVDHSGVLYHHDFKQTPAAAQSIPTLFLPSPHHRNPRLTVPFQAAAPAPLTPLNIFLLQALESSRSYIYIQTPNVTSQPAIAALLQALERGVNVTIVTSERLQLLEQVITAGTTSPRCVSKLIARHQALANPRDGDVEDTAALRLGRLKVSYYKARDGQEASHDEPVQSHFKLTVVDGEVAVFGSGNMDRPSWYTSQELGVAFFDTGFVGRVEEGVEEALSGRRKLAYEG
jgi:phosphatidylserine/phosphatidylglycerophosphate/cardiolipin synthase-like enzyme